MPQTGTSRHVIMMHFTNGGMENRSFVVDKDVLFLAARLAAYWPAPIQAVAHC